MAAPPPIPDGPGSVPAKAGGGSIEETRDGKPEVPALGRMRDNLCSRPFLMCTLGYEFDPLRLSQSFCGMHSKPEED
jgi:hypothetical protein